MTRRSRGIEEEIEKRVRTELVRTTSEIRG